MYNYPYFYNIMDLYNYEQMNNEMLFANMMRGYNNRDYPKKDFTIE